MEAAPAAIPVNPRSAAITAITRKIIVQRNISQNFQVIKLDYLVASQLRKTGALNSGFSAGCKNSSSVNSFTSAGILGMPGALNSNSRFSGLSSTLLFGQLRYDMLTALYLLSKFLCQKKRAQNGKRPQPYVQRIAHFTHDYITLPVSFNASVANISTW